MLKCGRWADAEGASTSYRRLDSNLNMGPALHGVRSHITMKNNAIIRGKRSETTSTSVLT